MLKVTAGLTAFLLCAASATVFGDDFRLAEAAKRNDRQAVHTLLAQGVEVNTPLPDGATALAWAAYWDDVQMGEELIRAGANVNLPNSNGITPLLLASQNGSGAMVKRLLPAGADPAKASPTGATPLMMAARTGSVDAVRALLESGAEVNAKEIRAGQTALMWAVSRRQSSVAKALIEHGADVRARSASGFTPLMFAARQGDIESGGVLLAAGADVDAATPEGMTALMVASGSLVGTTDGEEVVVAPSDHERFALWLLDANPPLARADTSGRTALHYAIWSKKRELVKALLVRGVDLNRQTSEIKRPSTLFIDVTEMVWDQGATPLYVAAKAADAGLMRLLVAAGANVSTPIANGTTPLMAAAGVGRNVERTHVTEPMALEAVRVAMESGGDINAVNSQGTTAIHGATGSGLTSVIQLLADHGARLDVKDKRGQTPLEISRGGTGGTESSQKKAEELLRKLLGMTPQDPSDVRR